jgi:hypothetical protein
MERKMSTSYPYETGNLADVTGMSGYDYHTQFTRDVLWNDPDLKQITRLRLLTDPGFPAWDVSYCHGVLKDGTKVNVCLPFSQLPKRWKGGNWWSAIKYYAKKDGVSLWNLKVWDSISKLW